MKLLIHNIGILTLGNSHEGVNWSIRSEPHLSVLHIILLCILDT